MEQGVCSCRYANKYLIFLQLFSIISNSFFSDYFAGAFWGFLLSGLVCFWGAGSSVSHLMIWCLRQFFTWFYHKVLFNKVMIMLPGRFREVTDPYLTFQLSYSVQKLIWQRLQGKPKVVLLPESTEAKTTINTWTESQQLKKRSLPQNRKAASIMFLWWQFSEKMLLIISKQVTVLLILFLTEWRIVQNFSCLKIFGLVSHHN